MHYYILNFYNCKDESTGGWDIKSTKTIEEIKQIYKNAIKDSTLDIWEIFPDDLDFEDYSFIDYDRDIKWR